MIAEMYSDNAVDVLKAVGKKMSALIYAWCHINGKWTPSIIKLWRRNRRGDDDNWIYRRSWIRYLKTAMATVKRFAEDAETIYYVYVTDDENHLTGFSR